LNEGKTVENSIISVTEQAGLEHPPSSAKQGRLWFGLGVFLNVLHHALLQPLSIERAAVYVKSKKMRTPSK